MTRRARNAIVAEHLGLVVAIARGVHRRLPAVFAFDDLVAEGNVALIGAAAKYNPAAHNGTPFSAFARQYIRGAMIESCRRKRYTEATRPSIDDHDCSDAMLSRSPRRGVGTTALYEGQIARALRAMASPPSVEDDIDRARLDRRIRDAMSWLADDQRQLLTVLYFEGDGLTIYLAARLLRITRARAEALHALAIANLQARLFPGRPIPRSEGPKGWRR